MKINAYPIARTHSHVTVKCADNINRIVEWNIWNHTQKEAKEVEATVKAGSCVMRLPYGCDRLERSGYDPLIIDMFNCIAKSLGGLCVTDKTFATQVAEKAVSVAARLDTAALCSENQKWLADAQVSICKYKRNSNKKGVAKKYAEIIRYFLLFDVLDIDICVEPRKNKYVAYKVSTINGYSFDLTVNYRALSDEQAAELSECLLNGKKPDALSEALQKTAYDTYHHFLYYGVIQNLCRQESYKSRTYNTPFTQSLVATAFKKGLCTKETANAVLKVIDKPNLNNLATLYEDDIKNALFDFLYDTHPYEITEA